jgi:hypothetical protein
VYPSSVAIVAGQQSGPLPYDPERSSLLSAAFALLPVEISGRIVLILPAMPAFACYPVW